MKNLIKIIFIVTSIICFSDKAFSNPENQKEIKDPFENYNRKVYEFNTAFEKKILMPMAKTYNKITPKPLNKALLNFVNNINEPITFVHDVLQGEGERAAETFYRFMVNSVIGVFGIFDVAGKMGVKKHYEDFGQTLGVWGMESGSFIMLPFMGPSSTRDTFGKVIDFFINPLYLFLDYQEDENNIESWVSYTLVFTDIFIRYADKVELIESLQETSIDPYSNMKNIYFENRKLKIGNKEKSGLSLNSNKEEENNYDFEFNFDNIE